MTLIVYKPTTPGNRHRLALPHRFASKSPRSMLLGPVKKSAGRNYTGKVTIRHRGGGHKRQLRMIDFRRDKIDVTGKVTAIHYDPNRSADLALVTYPDGDKRYILAPVNLKVGDVVISAKAGEIKPGNCLNLSSIPVGTPIHNVELTLGKGGQIIRSAGSQGLIQSKENGFAAILLPSKEIRLVHLDCKATIGQVCNPDQRNVNLGKAGRRRHLGWRPSVRGVAMHPHAHPHGGGEGRSGIGMPSPKSPWGKPTLGKKTRTRKKYSNKYIIKHGR